MQQAFAQLREVLNTLNQVYRSNIKLIKEDYSVLHNYPPSWWRIMVIKSFYLIDASAILYSLLWQETFEPFCNGRWAIKQPIIVLQIEEREANAVFGLVFFRIYRQTPPTDTLFGFDFNKDNVFSLLNDKLNFCSAIGRPIMWHVVLHLWHQGLQNCVLCHTTFELRVVGGGIQRATSRLSLACRPLGTL